MDAVLKKAQEEIRARRYSDRAESLLASGGVPTSQSGFVKGGKGKIRKYVLWGALWGVCAERLGLVGGDEKALPNPTLEKRPLVNTLPEEVL